MDASMRRPLRAVIRWALLGSGIAAAVVLLSLLLGARPAAAAEGKLLGVSPSGVTSSVGGAVQGVTGGVGQVLDSAVAPVRSCLLYTSPSPRDIS
ncbi:hypothetical protein, partial [Curtobacterium sp. MCPF17_046]|uniref:hypothetical protein n=1 Tax=Curtobacterium sp. MCPF17_046 TaxID=2175663 RepID=UPI000D9653C6